MGFWIGMTATSLLVPAIIIVIGAIFSRKAPKTINYLFGYKTARSMKNRDTWEFAHNYSGKLMRIIGAVLVPISIAVMLFVRGGSEKTVSTVACVLLTVQTMALVFAIVPTELALTRTFDKDGNRK